MIKSAVQFLLLFAMSSAFAKDYTSPSLGIKNFRQYLASLEVVTGVRAIRNPDITNFFKDNSTSLPKKGRVSEFSGPTSMTYTALGGLFCRAYIKSANFSTTRTNQETIEFYSMLFLDRKPESFEVDALMRLLNSLGNSVSKKELAVCSSYAGSIEFITQ